MYQAGSEARTVGETLSGLDRIAEHLDLSENILRRLIREESFPAVKKGGKYLTTTRLVGAWVEAQVCQEVNART